MVGDHDGQNNEKKENNELMRGEIDEEVGISTHYLRGTGTSPPGCFFSKENSGGNTLIKLILF
ncbi:MAG: hypothetical protein C5B59_10720 [Bacteroidetes bacterium]|nr:MAG: hypothetical protein C5B59_10720 [Bacteroidota bacterium]